MQYTMRQARLGEYPQIEGIMKQIHAMHTSWRPDIYRDVDVVLPEERYANLVQEETIHVAVNNKDQVLGVLIYAMREINGGPMQHRKILYIDSLAVEEGARSQGIGRGLMDYARVLAKKLDCDGLELQVNGKNQSAKSFYSQYGFREKSMTMEWNTELEG